MPTRLPIAPLALAAVLLLTAARAGWSECAFTEDDLWRFAGSSESHREPLSVLWRDPAFSEDCRREVPRLLASALETQERDGLCLRGLCGSIGRAARAASDILVSQERPLCGPGHNPPDEPCWLTPSLTALLAAADRPVADVVEKGVGEIHRRIRARMIPSCLQPQGCQGGDEEACRKSLRWLWWADALRLRPSYSRGEVTPGGFHHLLLADAYACADRRRRESPCPADGAAPLVSYYCEVPDGCAQAQGVRCASAALVAERFAAAGCPGLMATEKELGLIKQEWLDARCNDEAVRSPSCEEIGSRLREASGGGRRAACLAERVYPFFGLRALRFHGTSQGWDAVRASVQGHHPAEIDAFFGKRQSTAVVDTFWTDKNGQEHVLVRDPGGALRASPSPAVRSAFLGLSGGTALCVPGDPRCP